MRCKVWHWHLPLHSHQIPQHLCPQRQEVGSSAGAPFSWQGRWGCSLPQPEPVRRKRRDTSSPRAGHGRCPGSRGHCIPPMGMGLCPLSPSVHPSAASPCMTGVKALSQPHPAICIAQHVRVGARRSQAGGSASPGCAGKPWSCPLPAPTFGDGHPSRPMHPPCSLPLSCGTASPLPGAGQ